MVEMAALTQMCREPDRESVDDQDTRDDKVRLGREKHLTDLIDREVFEVEPRSSAVSRPLSGRWIDKDKPSVDEIGVF